MAGVIVSSPGLMTARATSATTVGNSPDDAKNNDETKGDGGNHSDDECENEDGPDDPKEDNSEKGDHSSDSSDKSDESATRADASADTTLSVDNASSNDDSKDDEGNGDKDDDDCTATLTVVKVPNNMHGGDLQAKDFQLLVDGKPQAQNAATTVTAAQHVISEVDVPGYELSSIDCSDDDAHKAVADSDGKVELSAGQHVTCTVANDDIAPTITVRKVVENNNAGTAVPEDFHLTIGGLDASQGVPVPVDAKSAITVSERDILDGYAPTSVVCTSDVPASPNNNLTVLGSASIVVTPVLAENISCTITNHDTGPGLTVIKQVVTNDGGNEAVSDFPLKVNDVVVTSGTATPYAAGTPLAITETQKSGYAATDITCVSSLAGSANNLSLPSPDSSAVLATVTLAAGESIVCTVTNDDIAPTVTVDKVVVGGTKLADAFQMTVGGDNVVQNAAVPVMANTPLEVSEVADPNYVKSVACIDTFTTNSLANPLVLDEGQNAHCIVSNTLLPPAATTITVVKSVTNNSGGTLVKGDFNLQIDNATVVQGTPITVTVGAHTVSEETKAGYAQTGIVCVDSTTHATVGQAGSVTLTTGQQVVCTIANDDIPAGLTLLKQLIINDGAQAVPSDFQLQIDGGNVPQRTLQLIAAGVHTIGEVPKAGWRNTGINCTDDAAGHPVVSYSTTVGITLAPGQHVTCIVFNDDEPVDLVLTKSDDGLVKVAGGDSFNYTIAVHDLGPRDVTTGAVVTVTDQLPAGLHFVLPIPANCTAVGQTLTCSVLAANLQVADPPVNIVVSVAANPDAPNGTYTNKAFVDTAEDPACVGQCVPPCASNNNVDCEDTDITRHSAVTVDKIASVDHIGPGGSYSYAIKVANAGPSTFLGDLQVTDDLPAGLSLASVAPVTAAAPWSCNAVDPVVCTYGAPLAPGPAPTITINVTLDPGYLFSDVTNKADVIAVVSPPVPPSTTATVVTGSYTGTIPVVRPNLNSGIGAIPPPSSAASEPPVPPAANLRVVTPQLPRTGNGSLAG
ncbi:MAG: large repetitive protein, partial [Ilumatobacteraceae bacterium]